MKRIKNLVGQRYGSLLVVEKTENKNMWENPLYRCVCDCGKEVILASNALNAKKGTKSCGCWKSEHHYKLKEGLSACRHLFFEYRSKAKKAGREFSLSLDEFESITSSACEYCGIHPKQIITAGGNGRGNGTYLYNGIDRVDNSKGYVLENCVPCCGICNVAKRSQSKAEFLNWIKSVYSHSVMETITI